MPFSKPKLLGIVFLSQMLVEGHGNIDFVAKLFYLLFMFCSFMWQRITGV